MLRKEEKAADCLRKGKEKKVLGEEGYRGGQRNKGRRGWRDEGLRKERKGSRHKCHLKP